jgi:hypothetical protein
VRYGLEAPGDRVEQRQVRWLRPTTPASGTDEHIDEAVVVEILLVGTHIRIKAAKLRGPRLPQGQIEVEEKDVGVDIVEATGIGPIIDRTRAEGQFISAVSV